VEHPNEIELLEVINEIFSDFKDYWNTDGDYFTKNDSSFSVHSVFAVLSHYVKGYKQFLMRIIFQNYSRIKKTGSK
jgi:hypothetical protein